MFTTASLLNPVRITARCYYCTRAFQLQRDPFGVLEADDKGGRLCCEHCFCTNCGGGHCTDADATQCDYLVDYANPVDTDDEYVGWLEQASYGDPDAAYELHRDMVMELELTS